MMDDALPEGSLFITGIELLSLLVTFRFLHRTLSVIHQHIPRLGEAAVELLDTDNLPFWQDQF